MIVVATEDFEVYHGVVNELRDRGMHFTTIEPGDDWPDETTVAVIADGEHVETPERVDVVQADPEAPRRAVESVVTILRGESGRTVVGIDPGERPGVAILNGDMVVAAFQVPATEASEIVRQEVEDALNPIVRIGDGARLVGTRIIDDIQNVPIELVDETGTTPYLGSGARGMGDVLAAVNIARLEGEEVVSRSIEPTAGELQRIKDRSREESDTNRAISEGLAREVATGSLTVEEALAAHTDDETPNEEDDGDGSTPAAGESPSADESPSAQSDQAAEQSDDGEKSDTGETQTE